MNSTTCVAHEVLTRSFFPYLAQHAQAQAAAGDYLAGKKEEMARNLAARVAEGQLAGVYWDIDRLNELGWRDMADVSARVGALIEDLLAGRTEPATAAAAGLSALGHRELAKLVWRTVRASLRDGLDRAAWNHNRAAVQELGRAMTAIGDREIAVSIWEKHNPRARRAA